jgi:hypothetical protein
MKEIINATLDFIKEFGYEALEAKTVYKGFNIGAFRVSQRKKYHLLKTNKQKDLFLWKLSVLGTEYIDYIQKKYANYEEKARFLIVSELEKRNIDYIELSSMLEKIGINETNVNLSNKIQRGKFSFVFALEILDVLGVDNISLKEESGTVVLKYETEDCICVVFEKKELRGAYYELIVKDKANNNSILLKERFDTLDDVYKYASDYKINMYKELWATPSKEEWENAIKEGIIPDIPYKG